MQHKFEARLLYYDSLLKLMSFFVSQNDKSTNSVKVIGGDELSNLSGKVSPPMIVNHNICTALFSR